jgi:hypothetical protein
MGVLARLSASGGAPRKLVENVTYADWSPDGQEMAIVRDASGQSVLEYPAGTSRYATTGWISHPRVSRDGRQVAFLDHPFAGDDRGAVRVADADGHTATWSDGWGAVQGLAWSPNGRELWVSGAMPSGPYAGLHAIYAISADGGLRPLVRTAGNLMLLDVSPEGHVLAVRRDRRLGIAVRARDGAERDLSLLGSSFLSDLSADGGTVLFSEFGEAGGATGGVYLARTDGTPATRLGDGSAKALSPDLAWALALKPEPRPQLVLLPTGPGQPRPVEVALEHFHQIGFHPSGKSIVVVGNEPGQGTRIFVHELGGAARAISPEGIVPGLPLLPVSPDGEWVAAMAADGQVRLYPCRGGEPRAIAANTTGLAPLRLETKAGRTFLYAARLDQVPTEIRKIDVSDGTQATWAAITPADPAGVHGLPVILLSADGQVVYGYARFLSELYAIAGVR